MSLKRVMVTAAPALLMFATTAGCTSAPEVPRTGIVFASVVSDCGPTDGPAVKVNLMRPSPEAASLTVSTLSGERLGSAELTAGRDSVVVALDDMFRRTPPSVTVTATSEGGRAVSEAIAEVERGPLCG
jgi:hypothetical protein